MKANACRHSLSERLIAFPFGVSTSVYSFQNHLFLEGQNRPFSAPQNQAFTAHDSGRFLERPCSARQVMPTPTSSSRGRSVAKSTRETTRSEAAADTQYGDLFRVDVGRSFPEPLAIDRMRTGTLRTSILSVQIEKLFLVLPPNGTRVAHGAAD
jgi:hypothetical protein